MSSTSNTHGGQYVYGSCAFCQGKGQITQTQRYTYPNAGSTIDVLTYMMCQACSGTGYAWQITVNPAPPSNKPVVPYEPTGFPWPPPQEKSLGELEILGQLKKLQDEVDWLREKLQEAQDEVRQLRDHTRMP
jgi:hypothetical protein